MGKPIKTVLAASRSAQRKLDQVAAITAAGRLCDYRQQAIHAHAEGTAQAEQEKAARAHLAACAGCRSSYATLVREMRWSRVPARGERGFPATIGARRRGAWPLGRAADLAALHGPRTERGWCAFENNSGTATPATYASNLRRRFPISSPSLPRGQRAPSA